MSDISEVGVPRKDHDVSKEPQRWRFFCGCFGPPIFSFGVIALSHGASPGMDSIMILAALFGCFIAAIGGAVLIILGLLP